MKEYIIGAAVAYVVKKVIDFGVKKSKLTENRVDDFIFNNLKDFVSGLSFTKKK